MFVEHSTSTSGEPPRVDHPIAEYMRDCRELVLSSLETIIPRSRRYRDVLYDLILEYPLRDAKALRPALCIAACRALGGKLEAALPSACVLELYHNAFLIHDDVEDDSDRRRNGPTLHRAHGVPIAMNVGDAMLSLCLAPLLDNTRLVGLGPALRILQVIATMARESAEGQALELAWANSDVWDQSTIDYLRMVRKKTSHYTFVAPIQVGAIIGGAPANTLALLRRYAFALGTAFQIRDDVLNLAPIGGEYSKDWLADLYEGKRTLIVLQTLRRATESERARAIQLLASMRVRRSAQPDKAAADARFLLELIRRYGGIEYALALGERSTRQAIEIFARLREVMRPSVHLDFLQALSAFVAQREH